MDEVWWWVMDVIGPVVLLILLVWLALRWGSSRHGTVEDDVTEQATRDEYADEEIRRREGTDGL